MAGKEAHARPRRSIFAVVGLLGVSVLAAMLASEQLGMHRVTLDELNPFGSVDDQQLPDQLGQPPTLSAMLHNDYPPGFNRDGQASSTPVSPAAGNQHQHLSYVDVVSAGPSVAPQAAAERGRFARASSSPPSTWREYRASGFPLFTTSTPPAGSHEAHQGGFDGASPRVGATKAEREYWTMAQGSYWRALDHFYKAEDAASNSDWIARRSGWASQGPEAAAHAEQGDKLLDDAASYYEQVWSLSCTCILSGAEVCLARACLERQMRTSIVRIYPCVLMCFACVGVGS